MNDKTKDLLDNLVKKLVDPAFVADTLQTRVFLTPYSAPARKWSLFNFGLMRSQHTGDARGFKQWQIVGRKVKKGARAIYILAPMTKKITDKKNPDEEKTIVVGFRSIPVFRYEDTEGEALADLPDLAALDAEKESLPLYDVCERLGVAVSYAPSPGDYRGYYAPIEKEIVLSTDAEQTFFHELSHAIDAELNGGLAKPGSKDSDFDEIVAELSACFLASLYGRQPANLAKTKVYVSHFSGKKHVGQEVARALDRVMAIYEYIAEDSVVSVSV